MKAVNVIFLLKFTSCITVEPDRFPRNNTFNEPVPLMHMSAFNNCNLIRILTIVVFVAAQSFEWLLVLLDVRNRRDHIETSSVGMWARSSRIKRIQ